VITECHRDRQPAISVDTKKKELVGDFNNGGREWRPRANRSPSTCMIFWIRCSARRSPVVYDLANNEG
jgi:hypothetical protein